MPHDPCFSTDPSGRRLCQRSAGHEGHHHCSFPGGSLQWTEEEEEEEEEGGTALDTRTEVDGDDDD